MNINYMLIDRLMYRNDIFKKSLFAGTLFSSIYVTYKYFDHHDLRVKEGRCDKELIEFGNCLEKNNDNSEKCTHLLEAYKRCLQRS